MGFGSGMMVMFSWISIRVSSFWDRRHSATLAAFMQPAFCTNCL